MDITSIIKAIAAPYEERGAEALAQLKPGDQLTGRVLRLEMDGRILIDLGRFRALAQTTAPVKPGDQLRLQVVQGGSPLHLRVEASGTGDGKSFLPTMSTASVLSDDERARLIQVAQRMIQGESAGVGAKQANLPDAVKVALMQIRQLFDPLPIDQAPRQVAGWLRANLQDSGLFFEHKLAAANILGKTEAAPTSGDIPVPIRPIIQHSTQPAEPIEPIRSDSSGIAQSRIPETFWTQSAVPEDQAGRQQAVGGPPASTPLSVFLQELAKSPDPGAILRKLDAMFSEDKALPESKARDAIPPIAGTGAHDAAVKVAVSVLRDVKAQLLVIKNYLAEMAPGATASESITGKEAAFLHKTVERLFAHIELQQDRLVQKADDGAAYQVVSHWMTVEEQNRPVRLKVYYPKKGAAPDQGHYQRIALLLDMDRLGMVRVDLAMLGRQLHIDFFVNRPAVKARIENHKDEIAAALGPRFEALVINIRVSREKIRHFDDEDNLRTAVGRVDVKA